MAASKRGARKGSRAPYGSIEEIRGETWAGNHMADGFKMEAVDAFILANYEADPTSCKEAADIVALRAMGIDDPITDDQLREHVEMLRDLGPT